MRVPTDRPWFDFWPYGVPKQIEYPKAPLYQFLIDSARRCPHRPAVTCGEVTLTYQELDLKSTRFANALQELGIEKGDRVMILLPNAPEFVVAYFGILKAGAIMTAASPLCKENEIKRHITDADPTIIVCENRIAPLMKDIVSEGSKRLLIVVGGPEDTGDYMFEDLIEKSSSSFSHIDIRPEDDIAVLQYSGGTTGLPKGAMMTHSNLVANAIQNGMWFKWTQTDIVLGVLSLCHTWGLCTCINSSIHAGASILLVRRFDPEEILSVIEKEKISIAYGSASMFNMLLTSPDIEKHNLSSLRLTKAGAMPVPTELKRKWDAMGACELVLGYGLTEASPETHDSPPERVKPGTIGIPIVDTDAKIVDIETGTREADSAEVGELIVRGPQVMKGYWNNQEETSHTLRDGWLFTGDIAKMDKEGYFYIVDRKKELIKYKGYSIFPAELENIFYEHSAVKECAVVGKPSAHVGEIPKAYIVRKEGTTITAQDVIAFAEKRIAPFKRIREVEFVRELPKSVVGKTLRRELRERAANTL